MRFFKYRMGSFAGGIESARVDVVPLDVVQIAPGPNDQDAEFVAMRCLVTAAMFRSAARIAGVVSQEDIDAGRVEVAVDRSSAATVPPDVHVILNRVDAFTFEAVV